MKKTKHDAAIEIARRAVKPHLHGSAVAHPPAHHQPSKMRSHPLTEHLLAKHQETLREAEDGDADVLFHADHPEGKHALVVQVRRGKVARILTRA